MVIVTKPLRQSTAYLKSQSYRKSLLLNWELNRIAWRRSRTIYQTLLCEWISREIVVCRVRRLLWWENLCRVWSCSLSIRMMGRSRSHQIWKKLRKPTFQNFQRISLANYPSEPEKTTHSVNPTPLPELPSFQWSPQRPFSTKNPFAASHQKLSNAPPQKPRNSLSSWQGLKQNA